MSLPPELWISVLEQHNQPDHLWTTCRRVCSSWRADIPKIFAKKYLQDPRMTCVSTDCGKHEENSINVIDMRFDRFQDDKKTRCVFVEREDSKARHVKPDWPEDKRRRYEKHKYNNWVDCVRWYENKANEDEDTNVEERRYDAPFYQIRVKTMANDTELTGLKIDLEAREVSFEWFGMFDNFFREQDEIDRRMQTWTEEEKPESHAAMNTWVQRANAVDADEDEAGANQTASWMVLADIMRKVSVKTKAVRKEVRRERIKKWYKSHQNLEYNFEDFLNCRYEEREALRKIEMRMDDAADFDFAENDDGADVTSDDLHDIVDQFDEDAREATAELAAEWDSTSSGTYDEEASDDGDDEQQT